MKLNEKLNERLNEKLGEKNPILEVARLRQTHRPGQGRPLGGFDMIQAGFPRNYPENYPESYPESCPKASWCLYREEVAS